MDPHFVLLVALAGGCAAPRTPEDPGPWALVLARPIKGKYEDVAFPTPTDGWVISSTGDILHTSDGGDSWEVQAAGPGDCARDLRNVQEAPMTGTRTSGLTDVLDSTKRGQVARAPPPWSRCIAGFLEHELQT